jgi:hypothetical protein
VFSARFPLHPGCPILCVPRVLMCHKISLRTQRVGLQNVDQASLEFPGYPMPMQVAWSRRPSLQRFSCYLRMVFLGSLRRRALVEISRIMVIAQLSTLCSGRGMIAKKCEGDLTHPLRLHVELVIPAALTRRKGWGTHDFVSDLVLEGNRNLDIRRCAGCPLFFLCRDDAVRKPARAFARWVCTLAFPT